MTEWKWREAWLSEKKKIHSKPERHKDYIWEVVNNCAYWSVRLRPYMLCFLKRMELGGWGEAKPDSE